MTGVANGLVALLVGAIGLALLVAVHRRNVAAAANALVSLAAALLPVGLAIGLPSTGGGLPVGPTLVGWVATAGLLHSVGMLGLYESVRWWDHLTHVVSATLVATLLYAGVLVAAGTGDRLVPSSLAVVAVTLCATLAVGVFWELVELVARDVGERYDVPPVLVHYGWRDTVLDLGVDLVGAVVVVALDLRPFVPLATHSPAATRTALLWVGGVVVGGSVLLTVVVAWNATRGS